MKTQATTFLAALASFATLSASSPTSRIATRQDIEVDCNPNRVFTARQGGFQDFIDAIPDDEWDLNEARLPLGFGNNGNNARTANLRRSCDDCGDVARGEDIREMLHRGYDECVSSGQNDAGENTFWNYRVTNGDYEINAGGGPAAGSFGTEGTLISVSVPS